MITAAIFPIGAELLEGSVLDTNSSYIAKKLQAEGIIVKSISTLPDEPDIIVSSLKAALDIYDIVITTGGLGPTFDDLTPESVAKACGVGLVMYEEAKDHVEKRLAFYKVPITPNQYKQALLPENAYLLPNNHGTAYGFANKVEKNGEHSFIASMPGVPVEMHYMLNDYLLPLLRKNFSVKKPFQVDLRFANIPEPTVDEVISEIGIPKNVICIINAGLGEVVVKVRSDLENYKVAEKFSDNIKDKLIKNYIGKNEESPAVALLKRLKEKGYTLSVAESCTGGLLGGAITDIPGSSEVFEGGVISYSNRVKNEILKVNADILNIYGAVSEECALAMVNGVQNLFKADCSISVTGIAGPEGGSEKKPVGTTFIAVKVKDIALCRHFTFLGDRNVVRQRAVKMALTMLFRELEYA